MGNATVWNCGFAKSVPKVQRKRFPQFSNGASQSSRILASPIATPAVLLRGGVGWRCLCHRQSCGICECCHTHRLRGRGVVVVLSRWPGARELRELITQQRFGVGEQFQYSVPRALFPSLRTWHDSEGSQVPSCRAAGPSCLRGLLATMMCQSRQGLHLASISPRASGGR